MAEDQQEELPRPSAAIAWDEALAAYAVWRYEDVAAVLKDKRFSAAAGNLEHQPENLPSGPDPAAARQHVARCVQERLGWAREQMQRIAEERCRALEERQRLDLQGDLVLPWCQQIALLLSGAAAQGDDAGRLVELAQDVFSLTNSEGPRAERATVELSTHFLQLMARRRESPTDDLVSAFAQGEEPPHVLLSPTLQLFVGLSSSLPLLLGSALLALLSDPELAARYRSHPGGAVDELVRCAGPAQVVYRLTLEAARVGDHSFARGDRLALLLAHANHDPAVFAEPELLDFDRVGPGHLGFGKGAHSCLGAPIVSAAVEILPAAVLTRLPGLTPDLPGVRRGGSKTLRGVTALPASR